MKTIALLVLLSLPHSKTDWLNWSMGMADSAVTCYNLANGGHEYWNPTQSGPGNVAMIMGGKAIETVISHKCHKKLCRIMPVVGITGSAVSLGYSIDHHD